MRSRRKVWAVGLGVYLIAGLVFMIMPLLLPFLGAVVIAVCARQGKAPIHDPFIKAAVVIEIAIGVLLLLLQGPWRSPIDQIAGFTFIGGALLPIAVMIYGITRRT